MEEIGNWIWLKVHTNWIYEGTSSMLDSRSSCHNLLLELLSTTLSQRKHRSVYSVCFISRLFLNISLMGIGINIALSLYAAVVLPYCMGIVEDIATYNPRAIQIGAFSGFLSFLTYLMIIELIEWYSLFGLYGVGWVFPWSSRYFLDFSIQDIFYPIIQSVN